ncbi:MAG TPA: TIR domain-containing protein [Sphingomicrobium sp.]|nr:TIR domain-containing protein [Sphingomicrobium sp.]
MARVFLSYAREDVETAERLARAIADAGQTVWWDRHVHGGANFGSEIDRELKNAEVVMVLWTPTSVASAWVHDEAAEGRDSGRLVPVSLGSTKPPLGFRQFQCIDLSPWINDGRKEPIEEVLSAISKVGGDEASPGRAGNGAGLAPLSICVLPFVNLSDDSEQEYFSDGITEDIITDLSKVSALEVVARNSAFAFKGKAIDVKEVARTLDISHVVEGSVRKAGSRVRITAQLIAGDTGRHLWAERYDRDLTDIFAIQDEISHAIVEALQLKLLPEEKKAIESRGTSNAEAYRFYLMARQQWIGGTFGDLKRDEAIARICQQAVQLDENYAEAWALLAIAQAELRFWHGKQVNALPAAERALALKPNLPEALCVKARFLEEKGEQEQANALIEAALRGNPESWEVNREAARMLFREGRVAESIPYFEKAGSLVTSDYYNPAMLMTCYEAVGDPEARKSAARLAFERAERALGTEPTNGSAIANGAYALAVLGEDDRAREWIERGLLLDPENLAMRYNLACTLTVALQDDEAALDVLEHYFESVNTASQIKHMEADPDFTRICDDPRFKKMKAATKKRLGISPSKQAEPPKAAQA